MQQKYRTITNNLSYYYAHNAKMFLLTVGALFLFSFIVYMFFTVTTISTTFAYGQISKEIKNSESRIANLEAERIARMKAVDLSYAKDRGFVDITPTRYISKNSQTERFTLHTTR